MTTKENKNKKKKIYVAFATRIYYIFFQKKNEKSINSVDCANGRKQNEQVFFLCVTRRFSLFKVATKEKLVCLSLCRRGIVLRLGICDGVSVCVCVSFFFRIACTAVAGIFLAPRDPQETKKTRMTPSPLFVPALHPSLSLSLSHSLIFRVSYPCFSRFLFARFFSVLRCSLLFFPVGRGIRSCFFCVFLPLSIPRPRL